MNLKWTPSFARTVKARFAMNKKSRKKKNNYYGGNKMKNAKILIAELLALLSSAALSTQDFATKTLYRTGV